MMVPIGLSWSLLALVLNVAHSVPVALPTREVARKVGAVTLSALFVGVKYSEI